MDNNAIQFRNFFTSPEAYCWKWADNGEVIEWMETSTVVYRQDLIYLLNNLSRQGWPSLGAVVLTLLACSEKWKEVRNNTGKLAFIRQAMTGDKCGLKEAHDRMNELFPVFEETLKLLDRVHALEAEHRSGAKRTLLLQVLFEKTHKSVSGKNCNLLLHDFSEGQSNALLRLHNDALYSDTFRSDLSFFEYARTTFSSTEQLRNKLLTGIVDLPEPAVPETEEAEKRQQAMDLLDELEEDPHTFGMTKLTRRLIAALQIPMHARGVSDQSFGGVSDITNRGDFDRLLLSELANEDDTLMARLANNEALFLRREELPSNVDFDRYILVDTTIRLWGIPRVFAVAAALACSRKRKPETPLHTIMLGRNDYTAVDLETKAGVLESLKQVDVALHCGKALAAFMGQQPKQTADEYFFITSDEVYESADFLPALTAVQTQLRYIITVNREGGMSLYQLTAGHRKAISAAQFDLEELLFAKPPVRKTIQQQLPGNNVQSLVDMENPPALLCEKNMPLYWPTIKVKLKSDRYTGHEKHGIFAITNDQRVLHWPELKKGAVELLDYIEPGHYAMNVCHGQLFIIVKSNNTRLLKLYDFRFEERTVSWVDLYHLVSQDVDSLKPGDDSFLIDAGLKKFRLNVFSHFLEDMTADPEAFRKAEKRAWYNDVVQLKSRINPGYTAVGKASNVEIKTNNQLEINGRILQIIPGNHLFLQVPDKKATYTMRYNAVYTREVQVNSGNIHVKLTAFRFPDGSIIYVDSRGMLHFVSSNPALTQFSLTYIFEYALAGWAADGKFFGSAHFLVNTAEVIPPNIFYNSYIAPFILHINHAAHA